MDHHDFNDEHDAQVAEMAEQLVRDWQRKLLAKDERAINDLHNTVIDRLTEDDAKALFVLAATGVGVSDMRFACLTADAMYAVCKKEAEEQVERNLRAAADDHAEQQIDIAKEAAALRAAYP